MYGMFLVKGKLLNVQKKSHNEIMENAEINNINHILGL
jgi:DNA gyrase/topoisomerase IV subunit B